MYLGRFHSQISAKGRISLPARFKKDLGGRFVIARWYENCLVLVGMQNWQDFTGRFAKDTEVITRPVRSVERFILSTAYEIDADEQGRFVVPLYLRQIASLTDRVVFLGLRERIELWDEKMWEKEEEKVRNEADEALGQISKQRKIR